MTREQRFFIAVASADHVARGRQGGFMQVCHGKQAPLKRLGPGDGVITYSPTLQMGGKQPCQSFTAIGTIGDSEPYAFDMGGGFVPFRRNVDWLGSRFVPIRPLLQQLEFTTGKTNWGAPFRYGLFQISGHDHGIIGSAMLSG